MKVKVITLHDVCAPGLSLQAMAIQRFLCEIGHDAGIIDYAPAYLNRRHSLSTVDNSFDKPGLRQLYMLAKLPMHLKELPRKKAFDKFNASSLNLTRRYETYAELEADPPQADVLVSGSGNIWNLLPERGGDPAFFLRFSQTARKIGYAGCFASNPMLNADTEGIRDMLFDFNHVSVGNRLDVETMERLGVRNPFLVCDPVLFYNHAQWGDWADLYINQHGNSIKIPQKQDSYILYYCDKRGPISQTICKYLNQRLDAKIVSASPVDTNMDCSDCSNAGPAEFVKLVENCETVVTDNYYGLLFALIFNKPFYVPSDDRTVDPKIEETLKRCELRARVVSSMSNLPSHFIDFSYAHRYLNGFVAQSKEYLAESTM